MQHRDYAGNVANGAVLDKPSRKRPDRDCQVLRRGLYHEDHDYNLEDGDDDHAYGLADALQSGAARWRWGG